MQILIGLSLCTWTLIGLSLCLQTLIGLSLCTQAPVGLFLCTQAPIGLFLCTASCAITLTLPPPQVLTKDSVTVCVDGVVYYRVQNATLAVANITNADAATRLLAQTTLRNVLGTKNLAEILSDREEIAHSMQVRRLPPPSTRDLWPPCVAFRVRLRQQGLS